MKAALLGQAPARSQPALRQESTRPHATSRGGREALGMQEREVCAVHKLCMDLSALERVWGYVLAAVVGAVGVSLWVSAEVSVPPFELFFQR